MTEFDILPLGGSIQNLVLVFRCVATWPSGSKYDICRFFCLRVGGLPSTIPYLTHSVADRRGRTGAHCLWFNVELI
jgi:hypothetical protein